MSFLKQLTSVVGEIADSVDAALSNRTPLEEKLDEALSKKNYGVPSSLLREIAQETFDSCVRERRARGDICAGVRVARAWRSRAANF